ncbi:MAG: 4'-phosphopantetheinyl transferase superfamily protein [Micropruina sp.]
MTVARFAPVEEVLADVRLRGVELNGVENARWQRLRFEVDRDAHRAAHLLVRACAGELLDLAPERLRLQQHCPRCGSTDHGRPSIAGEPEVRVSLSHTRGFVAAVAATAACGIDVEHVAGSIPRTAVTPGERAWLDTTADPLQGFTRLWVRKEALVKAGVADEPGALDVLGPAAGAVTRSAVSLGPDAAPPGPSVPVVRPADRLSGFLLTDWAGPPDPLGRPVVWGCVAVYDEQRSAGSRGDS